MTQEGKPGMTVRQRKALMALHGITAAQVARDLRLSQSTVTVIINYYPLKRSRRVQEYIAQHTNASYERIWGTIPPKRRSKKGM